MITVKTSNAVGVLVGREVEMCLNTQIVRQEEHSKHWQADVQHVQFPQGGQNNHTNVLFIE